jgi:hypothetical protein
MGKIETEFIGEDMKGDMCPFDEDCLNPENYKSCSDPLKDNFPGYCRHVSGAYFDTRKRLRD